MKVHLVRRNANANNNNINKSMPKIFCLAKDNFFTCDESLMIYFCGDIVGQL